MNSWQSHLPELGVLVLAVLSFLKRQAVASGAQKTVSSIGGVIDWIADLIIWNMRNEECQAENRSLRRTIAQMVEMEEQRMARERSRDFLPDSSAGLLAGEDSSPTTPPKTSS